MHQPHAAILLHLSRRVVRPHVENDLVPALDQPAADLLGHVLRAAGKWNALNPKHGDLQVAALAVQVQILVMRLALRLYRGPHRSAKKRFAPHEHSILVDVCVVDPAIKVDLAA